MKYLLIIVFFIAFGAIHAQETNIYNVIRVNGEIFNITQSLQLTQGKSLVPQDELNFKQNSFAYVISNSQKKFMLRTPNIETDDGDIFANAELALSPIRSRGQLSTRGAMSETGVKDLKTYLGIENFNVIGKEIQIPMDSSRYPLNSDEYIVFYYKINGKQVSKKIGFNTQILKIEKEKLFISKGDTLFADTISDLSVYRYKQSTGDSELITEINLSFINPTQLKNEFDAIKPVITTQDMTPEAIKEYLIQYVFDIYGNVDEGQLNAFITQLGY